MHNKYKKLKSKGQMLIGITNIKHIRKAKI